MNMSMQKAPGIPQQAFDLMRQKTPHQAYADMQTNKGLPLIEALTFGLINTPIIYNKTGKIVGYVVYWFKDNMSAAYKIEENEWLRLLGMEEKRSPSGEECVEMYEKYLHLAEQIAEPDTKGRGDNLEVK